MKIKVGVIYGGPTVEHEVSIISAVQAMESMDREKYDVIPIYISKDRTWYSGQMLTDIEVYKDFNSLKRYAKKVNLVNKDGIFYLQSCKGLKRMITDIDIVFPIVHGNGVEDGTLQGYLETVGVPYVGSGVMGSSLGQDKVIMKQVMESCGFPVVPYTWFFDTEFLNEESEIIKAIGKLGYPVIVKPATLGSSVGITVVKEEKDLSKAIIDAIKYDQKIVVEKVVTNMTEINCSVIGNYSYQEISALEEVGSKDDFLTYNDKYIGNGKGTKSKGMVSASRIIPARIDENKANEIKDLSRELFKCFNFSGVCRIDYLIDKDTNKVYVNEPNTIPGSLAFYLWEPVGKKYSELLDELITMAIKNYKEKAKKIRSFDTNILSNFTGVKGAKGIKGLKK